MKNNNELNKELEHLSPLLSKQKGKPEGYGVPKDYFKSLPDMVMGQVAEKTAAAAPAHSPSWLDNLAATWQSLFQPRYALAFASVAILIVAGIYFGAPAQPQQPIASMLLTELPDEALQSYVSENIDEFDVALFEEQLDGDLQSKAPELESDSEDLILDELLYDTPLDELEDLL